MSDKLVSEAKAVVQRRIAEVMNHRTHDIEHDLA